MAIKIAKDLYISADGHSFILERRVKHVPTRGPKKGEESVTVRKTYYPNLRQAFDAAMELIVMRHNKMKKRIKWEVVKDNSTAIKLLEKKYGDALSLGRILRKAKKEIMDHIGNLTHSELVNILASDMEERSDQAKDRAKKMMATKAKKK